LHMRVTAAFVLAFLLLGSNALATLPTIPPLDRKTVVGHWEGILPDEPRLFILRLAPEPEVSLASVVVAHDDGTRMVFEIDKTSVINGRVTLHGKGLDDAKTYRINLIGTGTGGLGYGMMTAKFVLADAKDRPLKSWNVTFVMMSGGYVNRLKSLHDAGERALVEERRRLTGR
jgi:hypothetical protein